MGQTPVTLGWKDPHFNIYFLKFESYIEDLTGVLIFVLNLLKELRESKKKCKVFQASLFHNKFNEFNNTGEWLLDSIYHMTKNLLKNHILVWKCQNFPSCMRGYIGYHYVILLNL